MSQETKRDIIIEAARKRFAHFGVSKTTMNEIAEDLNISKASLYYYFPDKLNLYAAVLEHIIQQGEMQSEAYLTFPTTEEAVLAYMDARFQFFNKNFNILEFLRTVTTDSKELRKVFDGVRERQLKILSALLERGKAQGELQIEDVRKTVTLFLDCLEGLHLKILSQTQSFLPDKKEFHRLWSMEKEFALIFFRGLRCG